MFNNKFTAKDPLVDSVRKIMEQNAKERQATAAVNSHFGIQDRRALPHERQGEWDAAYTKVLSEGVDSLEEKVVHPNQQKLDVHEPEKDELTAQDFKKLRMKKIIQRRFGKTGAESVAQSRREDK